MNEINELYSALPLESNAREADNPWAFKHFSEGHKQLGGYLFDNAVLCFDRNNRNYTWHIVCTAYSLKDIMFDSKNGLEVLLKKLRPCRDLECVEVVTRSGEHHFIDRSIPVT